MKKRITIAIFTLAVSAFAQEAEIPETDIDNTYFHPAASMYIHGDAAGASNLVHTGLAQFPDNGKLLRLKELLDQQQQNQDQQNQDQQDQNQDQDQQNQDQQEQNNDQQNQDQQNQDQQDQNQDQQSPPEPEQPQEQNQPAQQEPPRAEEMSPDEAERLMDAMKQDEETKRLMLQPVMGAPVKVDKDW
ncbi:hypothetical protein [Pontiella agarivorans]|uniref:Uncharacterized protein n=1 Tax=Pontiella agarivorans TaxID=3038953 RepID=A0ABU5MYF5_9BACT|nr:hypothetical protein [Pontiella agarivorans]MDZ8119245.1 hypothetical protein [Pontiella agarivorans]